MKFIGKIAKYLLSLSGILVAIFLIWIKTNDRGYYFRLMRDINYAELEERVDILRSSEPYMADSVDFQMKISIDSIRAVEIRKYFQLDTLYTVDDDTWTKAIAIGKFVAFNIPHANEHVPPHQKNAIDLWEYTKNVEPAFNCRLHSILTFELLSSIGIKARYITCLPKDKEDNDCHVVNEVWLPEKNKWAMLDTDMGGHYVTDKNGNLLSLREMREHYIADKKMLMYHGFKNGTSKVDYYYAYMAKNTYWFFNWDNLGFYQEDIVSYPKLELRNKIYVLVPSGFKPFEWLFEGCQYVITSDEKQFWE